MSYVVPNGNVKILKDVPIERNYEHTLYFANAGAQYAYFNSKVKGVGYAFSDMSHIRVTTPGRKIRVPININNLYDCNYLIIQNNGNAGKVFYCFIDNVEYVNENLSEISYSIDVIQTWLFDYSTNGVLNHECFVEREIVAHDGVGEHILSENFDTGDLINGLTYLDPSWGHLHIVIMATAKLEGADLLVAKPVFLNGTLHSLDFKDLEILGGDIESTVEQIQQILTNMAIFNRNDTIINFIMMPAAFVPTPTYTWTDSMNDAKCADVELSFTPTLGTYTPKNNKLLTYPYTFFTVTNHEGDTKEFKYELFDSETGLLFEEFCDFGAEPSVAIVPVGYEQPYPADEIVNNINMGIKFTNFPKCIYAVNDLSAKFIQAGIGTAIAGITSSIGIHGAHETGNFRIASSNPFSHDSGNYINGSTPEGKHSSGETKLYSDSAVGKHLSGETVIPQKVLRSVAPVAAGLVARAVFGSKIHSFPGNGNINLPMGAMGFEFTQKYIRPEIAKMIDDYFTMYGYLVNEVKSPCIHNRTKWTYVKTCGCTVGGSIPNDDADEICNIFDNGITFWVNPSEVGQYSNLTNATL